MDQLPVYVINLDRRPDRRSRIGEQLDALSIEFSWLSAVDAQESWPVPAGTLVSKAHYACWLSHAKAMRTFCAQSESDYAMILEDDAVLDPTLPWLRALHELPAVMRGLDLDYLQLGHISIAHQRSAVRRMVGSASAALGLFGTSDLNESITLGGRRLRVRKRLSLSGAHTYIVSKRFAAETQHLNQPGWTSADGFYERLASSWSDLPSLQMGTVLPSLAEQATRVAVDQPLDTDLGGADR